ncbi:MAG: aminoacyl--tRNA ligase-related protein [Parcubacteria group bacterium]|jgi:prolyl-tRNA synthetase
MKQSQLFTRTQKFAPQDEVSKNAQLLIRAGFIHKEMAGAYSFLPLGLRVLNKVIGIIREEMDAIGCQELFMTSLQSKDVWGTTGRWSDEVVDNWFKTSLKNGTEVGLAFTHEEVLTSMMKDHVSSYKNLPFSVYQFQTKFRNEARAKSGIMRGREFIMKDAYSFSPDQKEHEMFYENAKKAYLNIFRRVGIGDHTYLTFAGGGTFSKYSHEFQTVCDAGEDIIYVSEEKNMAINQEVYTDEVLADLGVSKESLVQKKAAEVGNIFSLGTKFSDAFDLTYDTQDGTKQKVIMGSYGIGPARVMGVVTELFADDKGLVWPDIIAPFLVHLVSLEQDEQAQKIYDRLTVAGIEVLYDDRNVRAGEKFADADLIGCPYRVVVSKKSLEQGGVEVRRRTESESIIMTVEEIVEKCKKEA